MAVTKIIRNAIQCLKCGSNPGFSLKHGDDENVSITEKRKCECGQVGVYGGFHFMGRIWPEGKSPDDWFEDISIIETVKDEEEIKAEREAEFQRVFPGRERNTWYEESDKPPADYQVIAVINQRFMEAVFWSARHNCWVYSGYEDNLDNEDEQEREDDRFLYLGVDRWMVPSDTPEVSAVQKVQ